MKFINKALTGLILSLSCLVSTANAGLILSDETQFYTSGATYSETFDVSAFKDYTNLVFSVNVRGDYDGSEEHEFIEFLIDDKSFGQFYFDTDELVGSTGPSEGIKYDHLMEFSFTINDIDWNTVYANNSEIKIGWQNGRHVGVFETSYVNYSLTGTPGEPSVVDPKPVPAPTTLAIFALGMIGLASRRFKKQS